MQLNFNPGDLVRYTFYADYNLEAGHAGDELEMYGIVVRGGQHNALVHLNGHGEAGWISDEYLEVISNA